MYYMVVSEVMDNECGHNIGEYDTLSEAQEYMAKDRRHFEAGEHYETADVHLCIVLSREVWECKGQS